MSNATMKPKFSPDVTYNAAQLLDRVETLLLEARAVPSTAQIFHYPSADGRLDEMTVGIERYWSMRISAANIATGISVRIVYFTPLGEATAVPAMELYGTELSARLLCSMAQQMVKILA